MSSPKNLVHPPGIFLQKRRLGTTFFFLKNAGKINAGFLVSDITPKGGFSGKIE